MPGTLHISSHLILITTLWSRYYDSSDEVGLGKVKQALGSHK